MKGCVKSLMLVLTVAVFIFYAAQFFGFQNIYYVMVEENDIKLQVGYFCYDIFNKWHQCHACMTTATKHIIAACRSQQDKKVHISGRLGGENRQQAGQHFFH